MSNEAPSTMPSGSRRPISFLPPLLTAALLVTTAAARANDPSGDLSGASALSIGVSIAVPAALIAGAGTLAVKSVEVSGDGIAWVLENSVDGSRAVIRFGGRALGASGTAVGTVLVATAVGAGWVLSEAGRAVAFVPNEAGKALLHDEKVS
jgi:hypothetical protein